MGSTARERKLLERQVAESGAFERFSRWPLDAFDDQGDFERPVGLDASRERPDRGNAGAFAELRAVGK
jgi:hypothetical protein